MTLAKAVTSMEQIGLVEAILLRRIPNR